MKHENRFDLLIHDKAQTHFHELLEDLTAYGWLFVKAQMWQESRFNPEAISPAGAQGLLQLMPATAAELAIEDPFDPKQNIAGGMRYLADQYRHLGEIPNPWERIRFALASYNGGRGYVNAALALARKAEGYPEEFTTWRKAGSPPGFWQMWESAAHYLRQPDCRSGGKTPDWRQMMEYVEKIESRFRFYAKAAGADQRHPALSETVEV